MSLTTPCPLSSHIPLTVTGSPRESLAELRTPTLSSLCTFRFRAPPGAEFGVWPLESILTCPDLGPQVKVIQQPLHRQPSTAAQYLQQMYAAQQQHLMLHTAALQQQQHLSSAQIQSLAAVQQVGVATSRPRSAPAVTAPQQSSSHSPAINLTNSPQSISRPQTSTPGPGITQQAVLLGNAPSPALTASQAQMYLRAQMLIFTPTATVTSVQSEVSSGAPSPASSTQVPSLGVRPQLSGPQSQLPSVAIKSASSALPPVANSSQSKATGPLLLPHPEPPESQKKSESRGASSCRTGVTAHSIIAPVYTHPLIQQQKIQQHQFVIQPRAALAHINCPLQPFTHQPQLSQSLSTPPVTSQAQLEPPSTCGESNGRQRPSPALQPPSTPGAPVRISPEGQEQRLIPHTAVILQLHSPPAMTPAPQDVSHKRTSTPPGNSPRLLYSPNAPLTQETAPGGASDLQQCQRDDPRPRGLPDPSVPPALDMTSGNGSSPVPTAATGNRTQNGENKPPQAVVKPQILTHFIEGFVIQEGAQPFPVGHSSLLTGAQEKYQQSLLAEKVPQQDNNTTTTTTDSEMEETLVPGFPESKGDGDPPKLKCELCGRVDFEYKFKRSKRFCSMACAKRYNVGCTKRVGLFHPDRSKLQKPTVAKHARRRSRKTPLQTVGADPKKQAAPVTPMNPGPIPSPSALKLSNSQEDSSRCSDNSSYEEPLSPMSASSSLSRARQEHNVEPPNLHSRDPIAMSQDFLPSDPTKWNVEDVYDFVRSLPGCQEISEEFRAQEIDGQALLLLKEDHLMSAMNIKLGPALKLYARISMLKDS
ncbi:polyhomeotic-like protein 2 isoform X4 [Xenopus laevis]|uniref:Polyhomeotic-like protein 2 isoform X4 n=1 Tax=Xenopus laevis TaxID=8355 RepID=A0A8J1L6E0_XENLA|nr:polyhomeotic-like protein 2 isoform X4 [Xenopus laevis]